MAHVAFRALVINPEIIQVDSSSNSSYDEIMIKLLDLIERADVSLSYFTIHAARQGSPDNPALEAFYKHDFKNWQEEQTQENFKRDHIVSIIYLDGVRWLFAGVYSVEGVKPINKNKIRFKYATTEVGGLEHLTGRVIVNFEYKHRNSYLVNKKYHKQLQVAEILAQRKTIGDFPGYKSVLLSFTMLQTVIRESDPSWKFTLSNVDGVYVIVDKSSGKMYVGSAYGGDGLWQRWSAYSKNGHGGNKEIEALIEEEGVEYASNFQFSILEIFDLDSKKDDVIERESHWKEVLLTRKFGLNCN